MGIVVRREQCPSCMDSGQDNVAIYDDGSKFCFSCNDTSKGWSIQGEAVPLKTRKITQETCKFFNSAVGLYTGNIGTGKDARFCKEEWVRVYNYLDKDRKLIKQKIKTIDKLFKFIGPKMETGLYGQWLWSPNPKLFVTIVEGEEDAHAVAQVQGYQYPVVSVPTGSGGARKSIEQSLDWLLGFKYVVLAFDSDESGQKSSNDCIPLFEPGKVKVARWPLKDAGDMLIAGREQEIKTTIFTAKTVVPKYVVTISDIIKDILQQPQFGLPYPWEALTKITYGLQMGEIHIIVGGTGIGKTEYIKDILFFFLDQQMDVGIFSFEQSPDNTARRLIGARLGVQLHLPGSEWDEVKINEEAMKLDEHVYFYNKAGRVDIPDLFNSIRYEAKAKGCKLFVIDNLKALGIATDIKIAEDFMNTLKSLVKELNVTVFLLSHVAKDKLTRQTYVSTSPKDPVRYSAQTAEDVDVLVNKPGLDWGSGRMPSVENVEGASTVTQLSDYVFALARDTYSSDSITQRTLRVKALKTRMKGTFAGHEFKLILTDEGRFEELDGPSQTEAF